MEGITHSPQQLMTHTPPPPPHPSHTPPHTPHPLQEWLNIKIRKAKLLREGYNMCSPPKMSSYGMFAEHGKFEEVLEELLAHHHHRTSSSSSSSSSRY
jgi:hypothetical protein